MGCCNKPFEFWPLFQYANIANLIQHEDFPRKSSKFDHKFELQAQF
jgi:hypothetical protein